MSMSMSVSVIMEMSISVKREAWSIGAGFGGDHGSIWWEICLLRERRQRRYTDVGIGQMSDMVRMVMPVQNEVLP
jgi:hypothetical protein